MDQIKIGKFIKQKRNEKKLTQNELSERLNVTNRAISKWENGICMPDSGIIIELCKLLNITVNDLFCGEVIDIKDNEKQLEKNLLEMTRLKQEKDKHLLNAEIFISILAIVELFACIIIATFIDMNDSYRLFLVIFGCILFIIPMFFALRIEQIAGNYECRKCNNKYIPSYPSVFFAMHIGRTRYMKCPKCGKKSWNKKVL